MSKRLQTIEQRQKQAIARLKNENALLRLELKKQDEQTVIYQHQLECALLRIAELEEIIFGKKKRRKDGDDYDDIMSNTDHRPAGNKTRDKFSYSRPIPHADSVTEIIEHKIDNCPQCHATLSKKQVIVRYIEDIRLACVDKQDEINKIKTEPIKQITELRIARGYCPKCQHWHPAIPIPNKTVVIGPKVRMFTAYAINILRMSYEQTRNILQDIYDFTVSDGEIANILEYSANKLNPELSRLKQRILTAKAVHLDETGHQTGDSKNYAWVLASGETEEAVFFDWQKSWQRQCS